MQTKADKTVLAKTVLALHEQNDAAWARQRAGILRYAVMRGWNVECVRCDPNAADVADAIRRTAPVGVISALSCRLDGAVFGTLPVSFFDCPACAVTRGAPYLRHDAEFTAHIVARELFSMKCASYAFVAALSPATGEIATWSRAREHFFAREVLRRGGKWCAPFHPGSAASVDAQLKALAEYLAALPKPCGVFAANCCIPCHKCHELQNRIEKLLGKACGSDSASEIAPARQIWHECTDIPETGNRSVLAVTANKTWIRMPVCDLIAFLRGIHRPMIRRWAYIDDLEALK